MTVLLVSCVIALAVLVVVQGLVQLLQGPLSTRQSKVPGSLDVKANVGVLSLVVPVGPDVIVVSGGVVSDGAVAVTVIAFMMAFVSLSASVTTRRTFLTPASWKVNVIVLPLPSGHCVPPGPSSPSSAHE